MMKKIAIIIILTLLSVSGISQKYIATYEHYPDELQISVCYANTLTTGILKLYEVGKGAVSCTVQIEGGELVSWEGDSLLKYIPQKGSNMKLILRKNDKIVQTLTFGVRRTPIPSVYLTSNNRRLKSTISKLSLPHLTVEYKLDDYSFKRQYPKQSQIHLHKCIYLIYRGDRLIAKGSWKDFKQKIPAIKLGDRIEIKPINFQRKMWNGKKEIITDPSPRILKIIVN